MSALRLELAVQAAVGTAPLSAVTDDSARIRWASTAFADALGMTVPQLIGRVIDELVVGGQRQPVGSAVSDFNAALDEITAVDVWFETAGTKAPRAFRLALFDRRLDPQIGGIVVTATDLATGAFQDRLSSLEALILERIAGGDALGAVLRDVGRFVEWTVPGSYASVGIVDADGVIRHRHAPTLPPAVTSMLDEVAPGDEIGVQLRTQASLIVNEQHPHLFTGELRELGIRAMWAFQMTSPSNAAVLGSLVVYVGADRTVDGDAYAAMRRARHLAAVAVERSRLEQRLLHQSLHDALTGLPNRSLMMDRIAQSLERTGRGSGRHTAVILLDLDDFKHVNDALGHSAGDHILGDVSRQLTESVRDGEMVGRFGGDEFLVVCEVDDPDDALVRAEEIRRELDGSSSLWQAAVRVSATIGVAVSRHSSDPETLVRDADAAMHAGKEAGGNKVAAYDSAVRERAVRRFEFETALRTGLGRDELEVHYQPVLDCTTLEVQGLEALVRWRQPSGKLVPPEQFIPVAEDAGLIVDLGRYVLQQSVRTAAKLHTLGWPELTVGVNVSAKQLTSTFVGELSELLDESGIAPESLTLEITESVYTRPGAEEVVRRLAGLGVEIAIDDFGTGYSSLDYLRRFPVAKALKLDATFIADLFGPGPTGQAIVAAGIVLGHTLDMRVVAEGVQEQRQLDLLCELGCDQAQGWLLSKAVPADDLPTVLADVGALAESG